MSACCWAKLRISYKQLLMRAFTASSHWRTSVLAVLLVSGSLQLLGVERSGVLRFLCCLPHPPLLFLAVSHPDLLSQSPQGYKPISLLLATWRGKTFGATLNLPLLCFVSWVRGIHYDLLFSTSHFPSLQSNWKIKQQITMIRTTTFFMLFVCHLDIIVWIHPDISWMEMLEKWLIFQSNVSHYIHSNWLW